MDGLGDRILRWRRPLTPQTIHEQLEESRKELRPQLAELEAALDDPTLTFAERRKLTSQIEFAKNALGATPLQRQLEAARAEAKENLRTLEAVEFSLSATDAEKEQARKTAHFIRECLR